MKHWMYLTFNSFKNSLIMAQFLKTKPNLLIQVMENILLKYFALSVWNNLSSGYGYLWDTIRMSPYVLLLCVPVFLLLLMLGLTVFCALGSRWWVAYVLLAITTKRKRKKTSIKVKLKSSHQRSITQLISRKRARFKGLPELLPSLEDAVPESRCYNRKLAFFIVPNTLSFANPFHNYNEKLQISQKLWLVSLVS